MRDGEAEGLLVEAIITVITSEVTAASDAPSADGVIPAAPSLSLASLTSDQIVERLSDLQELSDEELSAVTTVATVLAAAPVVMPNQIVPLIIAPPPPALPPSPYAPGVTVEYILTFALEGRDLILPPPSAPPEPSRPPKGSEERARRRLQEGEGFEVGEGGEGGEGAEFGEGGEGDEGAGGAESFWRPDRVELLRHAIVQSLAERQLAMSARFPNRTDLANLPLPRLLSAGSLEGEPGGARLLEVQIICDGGREHLEGMKEIVEKDADFLPEAGRLFVTMGGSPIALRLEGTPAHYTRLVAPPPPFFSPPSVPPAPPRGPPSPTSITIVAIADLIADQPLSP